MVLAKAIPAGEPRNETAKKVAWVYATVLVLLALAQLYAFEKFIPLIQSYGLPGGEVAATLLAAVIVTSEVFAVPFLLRMPLSPLMRHCSMVCGLLAAGLWLALGLLAVANGSLENTAILGAKVDTPALLHAVIAALMVALAMWSALGLSPRTRI